MGPIAQAAQSASVLVCVGGHDPSNQIHRSQPFYASEGDTTTISTSGLIFPHDKLSHKAYVLVLKAAVQPFTSSTTGRFDSSKAFRGDDAAPSLLRPDAFLRVLCTAQTDRGKSVVSWRSARALHVIQLSGVRETLQRLVKAQESGAWRIGWAVEGAGGLLRLPVEDQIQHAGTVVVLEVDCGDDTFQLTELASLQASKLEPGSQVVSCGSPFGLLAPRHFAHSLTWGHVSNVWPSVDGFGNSLLMLDIRVLPGMEGGPVLDERGALTGLLLPPLLNTSTRTEIPLAISIEELLRSLRTFFAADVAQSDIWRSLRTWTSSSGGRAQLRGTQETVHEALAMDVVVSDPGVAQADGNGPTALMAARGSVVLIDVGTSWASGVLMTADGLVLTNAHLLLPDATMDKKPTVTPERGRSSSVAPGLLPPPPWERSLQTGPKPIPMLPPQAVRRMRVRVCSQGGFIWTAAHTLYVCQGSLDLAVIRIDLTSSTEQPELHAMPIADMSPHDGDRVHVIGEVPTMGRSSLSVPWYFRP